MCLYTKSLFFLGTGELPVHNQSSLYIYPRSIIKHCIK